MANAGRLRTGERAMAKKVEVSNETSRATVRFCPHLSRVHVNPKGPVEFDWRVFYIPCQGRECLGWVEGRCMAMGGALVQVQT